MVNQFKLWAFFLWLKADWELRREAIFAQEYLDHIGYYRKRKIPEDVRHDMAVDLLTRMYMSTSKEPINNPTHFIAAWRARESKKYYGKKQEEKSRLDELKEIAEHQGTISTYFPTSTSPEQEIIAQQLWKFAKQELQSEAHYVWSLIETHDWEVKHIALHLDCSEDRVYRLRRNARKERIAYLQQISQV